MIDQKESQPQPPHPARDNSPTVTSVLAEFSLDNTHCMVVVENGAAGRGISVDNDASGPRLGWLDISGRRYAVYARTAAPRASKQTGTQSDPDPLTALTTRELQIVRLVCLGCVNKQIAHKLHISEYTVKTYLKQIFCKLNVHSRSAMGYRCASWAIVEPALAATHE